MSCRILDLFCGAGGAAEGYARAGFEVVGVDSAPQPHYPFEFRQCDAMELLNDVADHGEDVLHDSFGHIDAIHASPPCQAYSVLSRCRPGLAARYPKLIGQVRELLLQTGLPYVIENVPGAPLRDYGQLCGTNFGLFTVDPVPLELQRHRWFETNWPLRTFACIHAYPALPVYGHGAPGNRPDLRGLPVATITRRLMDIDWMTRDELNEAIPPAFTAFVGRQLRSAIAGRSAQWLTARIVHRKSTGSIAERAA